MVNRLHLSFTKAFVFPAALVATTGSGGVRGEDASGVDVEHPCGGSAVVERPTAVTVQSTVKAEHVSRLLTRALHRVADIKHTYVSIQYTLVSFCPTPIRSIEPHTIPYKRKIAATFHDDSHLYLEKFLLRQY